MMSYLSLGGLRCTGFFVGGGNRLIGLTSPSNNVIRSFAVSSCINNYKVNSSISTRSHLAPLLPLTKGLSLSSTNNGILQQLQSRQMSSTGDFVKLWTAEKILSAALVGIVPLAFLFPSAMMDYLLAFSITLHAHWGIEAVVVDYVRPSIFGNIIPKVGVGAVYALSALTLGGLFYFIYTDVGIVNAIKMLWKV